MAFFFLGELVKDVFGIGVFYPIGVSEVEIEPLGLEHHGQGEDGLPPREIRRVPPQKVLRFHAAFQDLPRFYRLQLGWDDLTAFQTDEEVKEVLFVDRLNGGEFPEEAGCVRVFHLGTPLIIKSPEAFFHAVCDRDDSGRRIVVGDHGHPFFSRAFRGQALPAFDPPFEVVNFLEPPT